MYEVLYFLFSCVCFRNRILKLKCIFFWYFGRSNFDVIFIWRFEYYTCVCSKCCWFVQMSFFSVVGIIKIGSSSFLRLPSVCASWYGFIWKILGSTVYSKMLVYINFICCHKSRAKPCENVSKFKKTHLACMLFNFTGSLILYLLTSPTTYFNLW